MGVWVILNHRQEKKKKRRKLLRQKFQMLVNRLEALLWLFLIIFHSFLFSQLPPMLPLSQHSLLYFASQYPCEYNIKSLWVGCRVTVFAIGMQADRRLQSVRLKALTKCLSGLKAILLFSSLLRSQTSHFLALHRPLYLHFCPLIEHFTAV